MTLSIAWVKTSGERRELVVATDSRLSGGKTWDCGPKIFSLPRSDSLICFAGETDYAYPLMMQMASAIEQYPESRSREMDITHMKGHTLRVFNRMIQDVDNLPHSQDSVIPEAAFILGGYSWKHKRFYIWLLHYDDHDSQYTYRPASPWGGVDGHKVIKFTGDHEDVAKEKLIEKLRKKDKLEEGGFDYEPLSVLVDMIRDESYTSIGGPPQVMKVYQHMNSLPFVVYWPDRESGNLTLLGRPLLGYEKTHYPSIDPDTFDISSGWEF